MRNWPPPEGLAISPPYADFLGSPSYDVCLRCGFEFGNDDDPGVRPPLSFEAYRERWHAKGEPWFDEDMARQTRPAFDHRTQGCPREPTAGLPQSVRLPLCQRPGHDSRLGAAAASSVYPVTRLDHVVCPARGSVCNAGSGTRWQPKLDTDECSFKDHLSHMRKDCLLLRIALPIIFLSLFDGTGSCDGLRD